MFISMFRAFNSTHFQVGGDNSKVEGEPAKSVYKTKLYFTLTLTFSFWKQSSGGGGIQLEGKFTLCKAAVVCIACLVYSIQKWLRVEYWRKNTSKFHFKFLNKWIMKIVIVNVMKVKCKNPENVVILKQYRFKAYVT